MLKTMMIPVLLLLVSGCASSPPAQQIDVSHQGKEYSVRYRDVPPIYNIQISGKTEPMHGGQLDDVRAIIAQNLDPLLCPPGEKFSVETDRKVTPLFLPQVDFFADPGVFVIRSSCA